MNIDWVGLPQPIEIGLTPRNPGFKPGGLRKVSIMGGEVHRTPCG